MSKGEAQVSKTRLKWPENTTLSVAASPPAAGTYHKCFLPDTIPDAKTVPSWTLKSRRRSTGWVHEARCAADMHRMVSIIRRPSTAYILRHTGKGVLSADRISIRPKRNYAEELMSVSNTKEERRPAWNRNEPWDSLSVSLPHSASFLPSLFSYEGPRKTKVRLCMKGKCWHVNWPTQSMILERCTRWRFLDTLSSTLPLDRGTKIDDLHLNTKAREVIVCKASH